MSPASEKMAGRHAHAVRRMCPSDASSAHAILQESPEASIWSLSALRDSVSQGIAWVAERDGRIAGVLIGRVAADEFEILNLAVAGAHRRLGIASRLVSFALDQARKKGAQRAYLEVRASNKGAISFYEQMGFHAYGRRANYYRDPVEDAQMLVWHKNENFS